MHMRQHIAAPTFKDPDIEVRVLVPIYVRGLECLAGTKIIMATSDARGLSQTIPATIEFLK